MPKKTLQVGEIQKTIDQLRLRIDSRFPNSGLLQVCTELLAISRRTAITIRRISRPIYWVRVLIVLVMAAFVGVVVLMCTRVHFDEQLPENFSVFDIVQTAEAGINELIFLSIGFFFLVSLELRIKRKRVVRALNTLRDVAHVIDMHQLTKDPNGKALISNITPVSPVRNLTPFELSRYLDYCSEMLSLASKLGYLYISKFNDPVATQAAYELENLTSGLSRKIWQKIMIIQMEMKPENKKGMQTNA